MARNRQIGPGERAAPVARPAVSSSEVQAEYRAMLAEDLGPAVFNRVPSRDDGQPVGLIRLFLRPAGLFVIALMALFAVVSIKLWREGVFESYKIAHTVPAKQQDKSWMLGDRLPPPPIEKTAETKGAGAIVQTSPATVAEPDEEEAAE